MLVFFLVRKKNHHVPPNECMIFLNRYDHKDISSKKMRQERAVEKAVLDVLFAQDKHSQCIREELQFS